MRLQRHQHKPVQDTPPLVTWDYLPPFGLLSTPCEWNSPSSFWIDLSHFGTLFEPLPLSSTEHDTYATKLDIMQSEYYTVNATLDCV